MHIDKGSLNIIEESSHAYSGYFVHFSSKNKKNKFKITELPFYSNIKDIEKEGDQIKVIKYLLTEKNTGIENLHHESGNDYLSLKKSKYFNPIWIQHDPNPEENFFVNSYDSLESIQWHLLKHGVANFWLYPEETYLLSDKIHNNKMKDFWDSFIKEVKCPRWSFDFSNKKDTKAFRFEWAQKHNKVIEELKKQKKFSKIKHTAQGCLGCLTGEDSDVDKFIKCCIFWGEYRVEYLNRIRSWILAIIQDNDNLHQYKKDPSKILPETTVSRRHLHTEDIPFIKLHATFYKSNHNNIDLYHMIFLKSCYGYKGSDQYNLKTVYGLKRCKSPQEAIKEINSYPLVRLKLRGEKINYCCHRSNWDAKICNSGH